ncbi:hypothetical protein LJC56_02410 [Christensenellaceae bacterium OttesenSCG-928-K19]|nr:hypothetical protein [Christensenellaceae bacterium OttesenSCG-928-K19]
MHVYGQPEWAGMHSSVTGRVHYPSWDLKQLFNIKDSQSYEEMRQAIALGVSKMVDRLIEEDTGVLEGAEPSQAKKEEYEAELYRYRDSDAHRFAWEHYLKRRQPHSLAYHYNYPIDAVGTEEVVAYINYADEFIVKKAHDCINAEKANIAHQVELNRLVKEKLVEMTKDTGNLYARARAVIESVPAYSHVFITCTKNGRKVRFGYDTYGLQSSRGVYSKSSITGGASAYRKLFNGTFSIGDKVTKANISVRINDAFMQAVVNDKPFQLSFTRKETGETISKEVQARDIFKKLARQNWKMGEPGILNWSRIEQWNLLSNHPGFKYTGVNPCAEEPLPAGGSCLLGSINLAEFADRPFSTKASFDFDGLFAIIGDVVKGMNDVLDEGLPLHPLKEQRDSVADWRQIGVGVMGIGDMLIKLGIRYGSQQSIELCEEIAGLLIDQSIYHSALLAKDKGAFPRFDMDALMDNEFFHENTSMETKEVALTYGLRNSQLLTIAPTGSIANMIGVSSGIEPLYAFKYERKTESLHYGEKTYAIYTPIVKEYMEQNGVAEVQDLPGYFICANDIPYMERINMQAAWQQHIDAAISSTVNLPRHTTPEEVFNIYVAAWQKGLKGITIFRDGCDRAGILTQEKEQGLGRGDIIQVDDDVHGRKRKLTTGCGSLHCEAYFDPATGELLETFLNKGSKGGCLSFMVGLSRLLSLLVRAGVDIDSITDQLFSCPDCSSFNKRKGRSKGSNCPSAIGFAVLDMYRQYQRETGMVEEDSAEQVAYPCPECGNEMHFEGGCNSCKSCGYSRCE